METNNVYRESDKVALSMGVFSVGLLLVIVLLTVLFTG